MEGDGILMLNGQRMKDIVSNGCKYLRVLVDNDIKMNGVEEAMAKAYER